MEGTAGSPIAKPDAKAPASAGEGVTDETPVTLGVMEQYIGGIMKDWNEQQKKQFDSFMAGMSAQLAPIVTRVNELTGIINQSIQSQQAPQPQTQHDQAHKPNLTELATSVHEVATAFAEAKRALEGGEPSQIDQGLLHSVQNSYVKFFNKGLATYGNALNSLIKKEINVGKIAAREIVDDHSPV